MTYPEYTIRLERENMELREVLTDFLRAYEQLNYAAYRHTTHHFEVIKRAKKLLDRIME